MKKKSKFLSGFTVSCFLLFFILISCSDDDDASITVISAGDTTAPTVESISPVDGASEITAATPISVTFSEAMDETTITSNEDKSCSGSIQVTKDDFSSCIPMSSNSPIANSDGTSFSLQATEGLGLSGTYKVRVTAGAADSAGNALTEAFTSTNGFSTADISSWGLVDGANLYGLNKDGTEGASYQNLTVVGSKLYSTWQEKNAATYDQIRVAAYSGGDASPFWEFVEGGNLDDGINYDPSNNASYPEGIAFNSKLYMTWSEDSPYQIRVAVYNGDDSLPSWSFVDGDGTNGINLNTSNNGYFPSLSVFDAKLYAIWYESDGNFQIRAAVYNGDDGAPAWTHIEGTKINYNASEIASDPHLTGFNSKLYAVWQEESAVDQVRVAVYNGNDSSPSWAFVDGNGVDGLNYDTANDAREPQLTAYNGKLYVIWKEDNKIRVKVYNGDDSSPSWTFVDGGTADGLNYNPSNSAEKPQLTVLNNKLYCNWIENEQIRIALYSGNDSSPDWTFVEKAVPDADGINVDTSELTYYTQIKVRNGRLYATWSEQESGGAIYQTRVAVGR